MHINSHKDECHESMTTLDCSTQQVQDRRAGSGLESRFRTGEQVQDRRAGSQETDARQLFYKSQNQLNQEVT